jgi:hypothetical protein
MERYTVEFRDGHAANGIIEVTYWIDDTGNVAGEAYFKRDDYGAIIAKGDFAHPYSGLQYKLHVPTKWGKSTDAILDVFKWCNVGRAKPVKAE